MGNMLTKKAASGDAQDTADINKIRPAGELHRKSDVKYAVGLYDYDRISVESNGSENETSEHYHTPSEIEETHDDELKDNEEKEQNEKDEEEEKEEPVA